MYFKRDTALPTFFPLPQFLLARTLSANAKLLYALLLARTQLSQRNGWVDENGSVYVIYTVRQMALALRCSVRTVSTTLGELEREGLLRRKRLGITKANHLFLLLPDDAQAAAPDGERLLRLADFEGQPPAAPDGERLLRLADFDGQPSSTQDAQSFAAHDRQKPAAPDGRAASAPDAQSAAAPEWQELPTSKIERDNRQSHKTEKLYARLAYGRYGNVLLSSPELAQLRERFPERYAEAIDDLSVRIAAKGDTCASHCETLLRMLALERDG